MSPEALSEHRLMVQNATSEPDALLMNPDWLPLCSNKNYRGWCNEGAVSYCKGVKDGTITFVDEIEKENADKFCSCINSPALQVPGKTYDPECVDAKGCGLYGYKTTQEAKPCSIISCDVVYDIEGVGGDIKMFNADIVQRCGEEKSEKDAADELARQEDEKARLAAEEAAAANQLKQTATEEAEAAAADAEDAQKAADEAAAKAKETGTAEDIAAAAAAQKAANEAKAVADGATAAIATADKIVEKKEAEAEIAAAAASASAKEPEEDASWASSSTSSSNTSIYIGVGVGAVVLLTVGVVSYFIFRRK
jgi:hypothetical protein